MASLGRMCMSTVVTDYDGDLMANSHDLETTR